MWRSHSLSVIGPLCIASFISLKEMVVVRFQVVEGEDPLHYNELYTYFNSRNRCGVVSELGKFSLKDMYIMPLPSHSLVPPALMPFNGPGRISSNLIYLQIL